MIFMILLDCIDDCYDYTGSAICAVIIEYIMFSMKFRFHDNYSMIEFISGILQRFDTINNADVA